MSFCDKGKCLWNAEAVVYRRTLLLPMSRPTSWGFVPTAAPRRTVERKESTVNSELYLLLPVPGMVYTFNLARCYQFFPNCILRILEFATAKIERRKRKTGGRLQRAGGQRRSAGVSVEAGGSVCSTRRLEENDGAGKSIYCIGFHRDV